MPIVLLCAACGDNLVLDGEQEGPAAEEQFPDVTAQAFVPDVCSVRSWPSVAFASRDVDLSVAPTAEGAAIFAVDRAGGPLRGFAIDARGELSTKETGSIIRDDQVFTAVSAAYIDERLVTAAVTDQGRITIDMIRNDLGAYHNLANARGSLVADVPMAHARDQRLAMFSGSDGINAVRFDNAWQTTGLQVVDAQEPVTMTATRYREDSMLAWSTDSSCTLARVSAEATSVRDFACLNARLAMNPATGTGFMVYENTDETISLARIQINGQREILDPRVLADFARSPKIAFDGSMYWITYINSRNDVVIGFLAHDGSFVRMALEGTQPMPDGYELTVINGALWLFAVDGSGANAQRLCLKPVR